jgi:hypothetical protein
MILVSEIHRTGGSIETGSTSAGWGGGGGEGGWERSCLVKMFSFRWWKETAVMVAHAFDD